MAKRQMSTENDSLESVLIEGIHLLVYEKDIGTALNCFLETVCGYYKADKAYIFEIDAKKQTADNTFVWRAEEGRAGTDKLQGLSADTLANWMKKSGEEGGIYIAAAKEGVSHDGADFAILQARGAGSLMAAPLKRDDEIAGFLGIDNPAEHAGDMALLCAVADLVTADLEKRRMMEELRHAGCIDMLTGLKNRNEYIWKFNELKENKPGTLGVTFIDINGLKQMNDTYGHEYGDAMIRKTAESIRKHAPGNAYRIGGDEFIVLWDNIGEEQFKEKAEELKAEFSDDSEYSISMGNIWQKGDIDVQQQVKQADVAMYEAKQAHYRDTNYDRRRRR